MSSDGSALGETRPFVEPVLNTVVRNVAIALVGATAISASAGGWGRWAGAFLLMLWPTFGGHFLEIGFLNGLRPRLPARREVQVLARLGVWLVGGTLIALGMRVTAMAMTGGRGAGWLDRWWLGGPAFVVVELIAHAAMRARHRPSFYDGRG